MSLLKRSAPVSIATLLLVAASMSMTGSFACSNKSSSSPNDGGTGGAASSGSGGASSTGTGGSAAGTGGHVGTDAGPDVHADASGAGGAGGVTVLPDAGPNNYTCAQLLTCCNSIVVPNIKTMCLQQYTTTMAQGDTACGNTLFIIKAYGGCP